IIATGRSDYPNQVNNVLGFPFIFRGALDVRATEINEEMKMAATRALAALAKQDVPDNVAALYGLHDVKFGPEYLIPFPFDHRALLWVAPAVAWAAVASGVAKEFVELEHYREELEERLGRARGIMRGLINRAIQQPKRVVFPEGVEPKIIRAAAQLVDDGIAQPVLLGSRATIEQLAGAMGVSLEDVAIEDPATSDHRERYAQYLWRRRRRKGLSIDEAGRLLLNSNYYGSCMVAEGDADALVSGVNLHYPETIRPALQTIGAHPKAGIVSGMYMLVFAKHVIFCADTTVNLDPTAEQLAQIGYAASRITRTMGIVPRIAMLSYSNFGSVRSADTEKMARAAELLRERDPSLVVEGEMQADTAFDMRIIERDYPFSALTESANVLIFPNLGAGNIAYKLLIHLGGATAIGPILVGMRRPVHVLERGAEVQDIVNMAAVAVVDAQERSRGGSTASASHGPTPTVFSRL
ncbi:MAG TPA: phosphate acyltransferase, partial [Gemmatimonadaceae bacterium]|nr:phosphate acyltransferase [Gemmatimonadaceae bacterium]